MKTICIGMVGVALCSLLFVGCAMALEEPCQTPENYVATGKTPKVPDRNVGEPKEGEEAAVEQGQPQALVAVDGPETRVGKPGIEVKTVRLTAGGSLLDFRYRVTDPEKASFLLKAKEKPCLIHIPTGARFSIPEMAKIGAMRTSTKNLATGKDYFMMFANEGRLVKKGERVTVIIGDFRAENVAVE
jgi:hypothetical protein